MKENLLKPTKAQKMMGPKKVRLQFVKIRHCEQAKPFFIIQAGTRPTRQVTASARIRHVFVTNLFAKHGRRIATYYQTFKGQGD